MGGLFVAACAAALAGLPGAAGDEGAAFQVFRYETGYDAEGEPLAIPSIDPAGVTYHNPSGHVFLADSEIDEVPEVFDLVGGNIFEVSLAGDVLFGVYDVTPLGNTEPTGIAYSAYDDYFYMTNDFTDTLTRYLFTPGLGFTAVASVSTFATAGVADPEDLTVDPATGLIYVIDEALKLIAVYAYVDGVGLVLQHVVDKVATFPPGEAPNAPEGIAFDPESGHLFIVSHFLTDQIMYECTTDGALLVTYHLDELVPPAIDMQGLGIAPISGLLGGPSWGLLLTDGRIDNDADPTERDGAVTMLTVNRPPHLGPIVDPSVEEGQEAFVAVTASDADPEDTLSFALVGPVAPGAAIDAGSGAFTWLPGEEHGPGSSLFTVRVIDDGNPPLARDLGFVVSVSEINQPPVLDPIDDVSPDLTEEVTFVASADDADLLPALGDGLAASWPFDVVFQSTTGAHHGTPVGAVSITSAPGEYISGGGALSFDGLDDSVAYDPVSLPGDFTAAAWVMPLNIGVADASDAVVFGDLANMNWIRLESDGVRIKFNDDRRLVLTSPDFVNGSWQHLAVVRTAGIVDVYRDGVLVGTLAHPEPFTPQLLGRKQPVTSRYQGLMDDVAIWDRALDSGEIGLLYVTGAVADAGTVPANTIAFSLDGNVPPGAGIDSLTGEFSWTANVQGSWTFAVRAEDDHVPPASDEEAVTITVGPICGDGVIDPGENCANCPQDVQCGPGEECVGAVCQPICGNGAVDPGENCATCPQDVPCGPGEECAGGVCQPICGNGTVDPGEDCATCPQDVPCGPGEACAGGVCQAICGNGVVDPGEDCATCPQDVSCGPGLECAGGVCQPICGNGVVDPGENCATCPQDVPCGPGEECAGGVCQPICGNGEGDPGETCANCPLDVPCPPGEQCIGDECVPFCGNGTADPGENCLNCPEDVACPPDNICVDGICDRLCGNGSVDPGEDCASCPEDAPCPPGVECVDGICAPFCGNDVPDPGEHCENCPEDVRCPLGTECIFGLCEPLCGNGQPNPGEDCANCPEDVPCAPGEQCVHNACEPICGNGSVDPGENCETCPQDVTCRAGEECAEGTCKALCGNGVPDPGEDCANCAVDVACPLGTTCDSGACVLLCPWDLDADHVVSITDLLGLLSVWGTDPGGPPDFDGNGVVNTTDFLELLNAWGPCPE